MQWAYAKAGIQIPRVTDAQFSASNGSPVERSDLRPGDLVFFGQPGNIYHVGISMGGDKFLHAPKTGDVVKVASLKESYFSSNYAGARRFDDSAPVAAAAAARRGRAAAAPRDRPEGGRRGAGRGRPRRRRGQPQRLRPVHGDQVAGGAAPRDGPVHAGHRPEAEERRARRGRRLRAGARAGAARRRRAGRRRPAPAPVDPAAAADAGPPVQLPDDISDDYPGDDASKDEIAKWLAKQADKHGLPPELPVMASLVESGVKNLNYGDADSVGFFQMRVGIWDQGAYKGFSEHPELQAKWFIDQALAVKKKAIASRRRRLRQGPVEVGRVDRRHRAPGRAVPRPLPAAAQGSARAAARLNDEAARRVSHRAADVKRVRA